MSIKLHKEFGLNPTIPKCYWCGENKGEIVLLGAAMKERAPMKGLVINKEPCEKCKGWVKKGGVVLVSVRDGEKGDNPYRTGKFAVVRKEALTRIGVEMGKKTFGFIEDFMWNKLGLPSKEE